MQQQIRTKGRLCGLPCSRMIFSEYLIHQVLTVTGEWILRIAPIESTMIWSFLFSSILPYQPASKLETSSPHLSFNRAEFQTPTPFLGN